jgi:hypothetical protein
MHPSRESEGILVMVTSDLLGCVLPEMRRGLCSYIANEDIYKIVWAWFVSVRAKCHHVLGPMVQEYAKKATEKLGKTEFKAPNGWFEFSQKTSDSF